MKSREAIKTIMREQGVGVSVVGSRLGIPQQKVWDRLNYRINDIRTENAAEMLRVIDYKLVAVPRSTRTQDGWYEID